MKSQRITPSSTLVLYARFLQPRNHQGQSSAVPSWELIKPKIILETKKVCWCHKICQRQKARSKETAAEVPPRGSQQHSEFPRASAGTPLHCAAGLPAPAPLFPRRLLTCFNCLPALVFLSTPCKSHTVLSPSPHRVKVLPIPFNSTAEWAMFAALRSFVLPCLKPPSLPGLVSPVGKSLWGEQILPDQSGT